MLSRPRLVGSLLACLFLVPLLGLATGHLIQSSHFGDEIELVQTASWLTLALGAVIFALILGCPLLAGRDRRRMSLVFGPLVRSVMLLLAVSVLAQSGLFVYGTYTLEVTALHHVHVGLLAAVALGALLACGVLLKSALMFLQREPTHLRAVALDPVRHERFFSLVSETATRLNAQVPDHIVVGLEPNFFVTADDVKLTGAPSPLLQGRTLFVSLSLLNIFSRDELTAVIGHELGHFRDEDVLYSMKFAPTYARLGQALHGLGRTSGSAAADLGMFPARVTLSMCWLAFAAAERTVGRERELLADKAGAEAASAQALARALVKLSLFAPQWALLTHAHIDELSRGRAFVNLAQTYTGLCHGVASDLDWAQARDALGKSVQAHPVDTHPPLAARLQNLAVDLLDLAKAQLGVPDEPASHLIQDAEPLAAALSTLEAQWLVAIGAAVPPATPAPIAPN